MEDEFCELRLFTFSEGGSEVRLVASCLWWNGLLPTGEAGEGGDVQIFTKYVTQETIPDREKVMEVRQVGAKQLQEIMQSGKVRASGVFADARGGLLCSGGRFVRGGLRPVCPDTRLHPHRNPSAHNG